MSSQYIIPDLLATWPWKRVLNPWLDEVKDEANAWVESLALFAPDQLQKFYACDFNLVAALSAPLQSKEHLRIACDLMNLYFAFDEYTDVTNKSEAAKIANGVMDSFRRRPRKDINIQPSNYKIAVMAHEFFQRTVSVVGEDAPGMERFISDFDAYTRSVTVEAEDRVAGHLRTVNEHIILRRNTCAAKSLYSFIGLDLDIPNAVFEHPLMMSLIDDAADLLGLTNDMHSYSLERSRGLDGHNIITAVMQEYHVDLQQALHWLSEYTTNTILNFLSNYRALPSWGEEVDEVVRVYIDRVAQCIRGNDAWSYESNRYYGRNGLQVRKSRRITLLPPDSGFTTREKLGLEILVT